MQRRVYATVIVNGSYVEEPKSRWESMRAVCASYLDVEWAFGEDHTDSML